MARVSDVAIVGAGPYGLSAAAHLRAAGVEARVFGEPMGFWERSMPAGMRLRSPYAASHIADPDRALTLDAYAAASGAPVGPPIWLDRFIEYGRWFEQMIGADAERRTIRRIDREGDHFALMLGDGEPVLARRVVIAAGIGPFACRPSEFAQLPAELVSHATDHRDLTVFAGRSVVVVGAGQSALESAALLHEAGADVRVLARAAEIHWLTRSATLHRVAPFLYAPTDVGPIGVSWLIAWPNVFRRIRPWRFQDRMAQRAIRPAGASWLAPRLEEVAIETDRAVRSAAAAGHGVRLSLSDGSECSVDHVLLGTGFRVDISRYSFLPATLLEAIRTVDGYPLLRRGFESSVAGLHFLGAPAARSFGPLMRFVAGTDFAGPAVARVATGRAIAQGGAAMRPVSEPSPS
jgi:hypothetical protein